MNHGLIIPVFHKHAIPCQDCYQIMSQMPALHPILCCVEILALEMEEWFHVVILLWFSLTLALSLMVTSIHI